MRSLRNRHRGSDSAFLLSLADVLAGVVGILILVLISQLADARTQKTLDPTEQDNSGTAKFMHKGEISYNGAYTLPVHIYREYFIVPAMNNKFKEKKKYLYDNIYSYPELREAFDGYFGSGGKRILQIQLEPTPDYNTLQVFLQNSSFNSVTVDTLTPGCNFTLNMETKMANCGKQTK